MPTLVNGYLTKEKEMTNFSKFSAWDNEVREFIAALEKKGMEKQALTDWFYNEGLLIFIQTQSKHYREDVSACQKAMGHRPFISPSYMLGQKFISFQAMLPKFIETFGKTDELKAMLTDNFNVFTVRAVANHKKFTDIQAEFTTYLNKFLDENKNVKDSEVFIKSLDQFEEYKNKYPDLKEDIENHIILTKEYIAYGQQQQLMQQQVTTNTSTMFNQSSKIVNNQPLTTDIQKLQISDVQANQHYRPQ